MEKTRSNPHIKYKELQESVDMRCSKSTIRSIFQKLHMRKWLQKERPEIRPENAQKRLEWAQKYAHFTPEDWKRVIWSDECSIERGKGARLIWTWNNPQEQILTGDVRTYRTGKGVKKMFWAGFSFDQRSPLVPLSNDPNGQSKGITATVIYALYQERLPELLKEGDIFMHDNAPVHTARIIQRLLEDMQIEVMIWPPYSPDLNPIENLWSIMKSYIYEWYPELEHAPDTAETLYMLIEGAKRSWERIDMRILESLALSMPHRVQAVLNADGWYTTY